MSLLAALLLCAADPRDVVLERLIREAPHLQEFHQVAGELDVIQSNYDLSGNGEDVIASLRSQARSALEQTRKERGCAMEADLERVRKRLSHEFGEGASVGSISAHEFWVIAETLGWEIPAPVARAAQRNGWKRGEAR